MKILIVVFNIIFYNCIFVKTLINDNCIATYVISLFNNNIAFIND